VERFRRAAPLSREQRQKLSATDATTEFWWLCDGRSSSDQSTAEQQAPAKERHGNVVSCIGADFKIFTLFGG